MLKERYERNPELEARIMHDMIPAVESAYEHHMTRPPRSKIGLEDDPVVGTLNPLEEMYRAAKLSPQEIITPELCDITRTSYLEHIAWLESQGLDPTPVIQRAGMMNLTTENGISIFHGDQNLLYATNPPYATGLNRWTAEETFHGPTIAYWANFTGAIDSTEAHARAVDFIIGGIEVDISSIVAINPFVDPQEFGTYDAHSALGSIVDPIGRRINNKVGGQEIRHGDWFREIGLGIYQLDQEAIEYALVVEAEVQRRLAMPASASYENYTENAIQIAVNGLFTNEGMLQRKRERIEALGLLTLDVRGVAAEKAQVKLEEVLNPDSRINLKKRLIVEEATEAYISSEKAAGRVPFILGRTVLVGERGVITVHPEAA